MIHGHQPIERASDDGSTSVKFLRKIDSEKLRAIGNARAGTMDFALGSYCTLSRPTLQAQHEVKHILCLLWNDKRQWTKWPRGSEHNGPDGRHRFGMALSTLGGSSCLKRPVRLGHITHLAIASTLICKTYHVHQNLRFD